MAKVYFMDDRSQSNQTSLVAKMLTLFDAAGFGDMIKPNDVVAIKLHMGSTIIRLISGRFMYEPWWTK